MTLRDALPDDANPMSQLILSLTDQLFDSPGQDASGPFLEAHSPAALRSAIEQGNCHFLVAEQGDGGLAGVIGLQGTSYLAHLYVAKAHQGRGLARRLWQALVLQAQLRGNTGHFTVNSSMGAQAVYRRFGFRPMTDPQQGNGPRFVPMRLGPAESENERLVRDLCALYHLGDPERVGQGAPLEVDGFTCSITSSGADPVDSLVLYGDVGPLPPASRQPLMEALLRHNLLSGSGGGLIFGFSPASQHVIAMRHLKSQGRSAPCLLGVLRDMASQAGAWQRSMGRPGPHAGAQVQATELRA